MYIYVYIPKEAIRSRPRGAHQGRAHKGPGRPGPQTPRGIHKGPGVPTCAQGTNKGPESATRA